MLLIAISSIIGAALCLIVVLSLYMRSLRPVASHLRHAPTLWARILPALLARRLVRRNASWGVRDVNEGIRQKLNGILKYMAALKGFLVVGLSIAIVYLVNVLCQAFDCFTTPDGVLTLRADPQIGTSLLQLSSHARR